MKHNKGISVIVLTLFLLVLAGCGQRSTTITPPTVPAVSAIPEVSTTTSDQQGWYNLSDIQDTNGIYLKRGDIFFALSSSVSVNSFSFTGNYFKTYMSGYVSGSVKKNANGYVNTTKNDQIVYIGSNPPSVYGLKHCGYDETKKEAPTQRIEQH